MVLRYTELHPAAAAVGKGPGRMKKDTVPPKRHRISAAPPFQALPLARDQSESQSVPPLSQES